MHRGKRIAATFAAVATIASGILVSPDSSADALYYKEEDGAIVFTNVREDGVRTVPGFSGRRTIRAVQPLPATAHDRYIRHLSDEFGVSSDLIKAVALVESGFDPRARSPKGAIGLMQLMPATARQYGVENPFDPWQNLRGGTAHLRDLLNVYDGDLTLTLAAYNAGAGAVRRHGGVPPYRETRNYVRKVRELLEGETPRRSRSEQPTRRSEPSRVRVLRAADGTISIVN